MLNINELIKNDIIAKILSLSAVTLFSSPAYAQDMSSKNVPVINPQPDLNGVNVATGEFSVASPFSFNAPGAGRLSAQALFNGRRLTTMINTYLDDQTLTVPEGNGDPDNRQIRIHMGGVDHLFQCPGIGPCSQAAKVDGSQLNRTGGTSYIYIDHDGTKVTFFPMAVVPIYPTCFDIESGCNGAEYQGYAYAASIAFSDGEKLSFAGLPSVSGSNFISTVISNLGYTLDAVTGCTNCNVDPSFVGWHWLMYRANPSHAVYILRKNGEEVSRFSMDQNYTYYDTSYNNAKAGKVAADSLAVLTDGIGRKFKINYQAKLVAVCGSVLQSDGSLAVSFSTGSGLGALDGTNFQPVKVTTPNGVETSISYENVWIYGPGMNHVPVHSVTKSGGTWTYSHGELNNVISSIGQTSIINPLGYSRTAVAHGYLTPWPTSWGSNETNWCMASTTGSDVTQSTDELSRQSNFSYVSQGIIDAANLPSGNGYTYSHDTRGNVTQIKISSPSGGTSSSLTLFKASYDVNCDNPVTCNKPNWTRDANGAQTDYQYDSVHGGQTFVTLPADANGVRPQKHYTYEAYDTGNGVIYRVSKIFECRSQSSCSATSNEIIHTFTYWGQTFLKSSETVKQGDGNFLLTTNYTYDSAGRLIQQTSPRGNSTWFFYDSVGRKTGTISADPDGAGALPQIAQRTTYNDDDQITRVEEGTATSADATGLAAMSVKKTTDITYNTYGQKIAEKLSGSDALAYTLTQYSYDTVGRLLCKAVRMDATQWATQTDACTPQTSGAKGPDRITKNVYDAAGQLVQVIKAYGVTTANGFPQTLQQAYATYAYSANGKQTDVVDANGNHAQFVYDGFDRQVAWIFPSKTPAAAYNPATQATALASANAVASCNIGTVGSTHIVWPDGTSTDAVGPADGRGAGDDCEKYTYDANGNRVKLVKRDGSILSYEYDALNRVMIKFMPSRSDLPSTDTRSVYYSYDLQGRQLAARFDSQSTSSEGVTNTYDGFGRQVTSALTMDGITRIVHYCYDADGNRTRVSFPDGNVPSTFGSDPVGACASTNDSQWSNYASYTYDGLDRPSAILRSSGTATIASYTYNPDGTRHSFNGGVNTSYSYDGIGRLVSLSNALANSTYNLTISGDCADSAGNSQVCYNPASQITSLKKSNNLFVFNGAYNVSRNYTVNGLNQYTGAGSASFGYDPNGNLTSDGTKEFLYDIENRLVGMRLAGTTSWTTQPRYDPLGRLYEISSPTGTTRFFYDGDPLIGEYDASGNLLRRYVHGADLKADDPIAWYEGSAFNGASERMLRPDWQGSIALVTDNAGSNIYAVNTYDEYGIPGASNSGRFQYTGQTWTAELGMYYYKARFYSPTLGRFLQTDPIGYKDQINLYGYVANDPMDRVDFTGESPGDPFRSLRGAALDFAKYYHNPTIADGVERGTKFYKAADGSVSYTSPVMGETDHVPVSKLNGIKIPSGTKEIAEGHTHPADSKADLKAWQKLGMPWVSNDRPSGDPSQTGAGGDQGRAAYIREPEITVGSRGTVTQTTPGQNYGQPNTDTVLGRVSTSEQAKRTACNRTSGGAEFCQ